MKMITLTLATFTFLHSILLAQYAPKYKVKLDFQEVGYKTKKEFKEDKENAALLYRWHRTVTFREEFHFFLDNAPLKEGYSIGSIAGVVYPKKDGLYCTLSLGAAKELKSEERGNSYSIGEVRFFSIPKSMIFDLPLAKDSGFQKCTVTIIPIKAKKSNK